MSLPISSQDFLEAFGNVWHHQTASDDSCAAVAQAYRGNKSWTHFVLAEDVGLLAKVAKRLQQRLGLEHLGHYREWGRIDAMYAGGQDLLTMDKPGPADGYPDKIYAVIENENGGDVEQEMYKLILLRAPLKVLMFCDWAEDEREANPDKRIWLPQKLRHFEKMLAAFQSFWPEHEGTEYLFLVAARRSGIARHQPPMWRSWIFLGGTMTEHPLGI